MASEAKESATKVASQLRVMECQAAKLADDDLAAIFKYLPPYERLIVSEVCTKWRDISKTPWRDVTQLDLSHVPTQNIHAVIKKCPNLVSVSALQQNLGDFGRFASRLPNVTSLKCVECTFSIDRSDTHPTALATSSRGASWSELIWHNSKTLLLDSDSGAPVRERPLPIGTPSTLRRLQMTRLSALSVRNLYDDVFEALRELPLLESCILADVASFEERGFARFWFSRALCVALPAATTLRELCLQTPDPSSFTKLVSSLPALNFLYLNNIDIQWITPEYVMTQHPSLRVLVITASRASYFDGQIQIPARKLFANGFNAPPVPQLHLFLGKIAAEKLRFHPSPTDALKIYPIDAPLPEFLEKEEIKPIFEGSWIASRIKEGARDGVNITDYSFEGNAESILYVQ